MQGQEENVLTSVGKINYVPERKIKYVFEQNANWSIQQSVCFHSTHQQITLE